MPTVEIPLKDQRFRNVQRVQLVQDVIGIVVLAPATLAHVRSVPFQQKLLGMLEAVAIIVALASAARELFRREEPPAHLSPSQSNADVDITNLMMGFALLAEWRFSVLGGHKTFSPVLLTGLSSMVLAFLRPFMQSRVHRRRVLRVDDAGVYVRVSRFRKFRMQWSEVEQIEDSGTKVRFHLAKGFRDLSLGRFDNAEELRRAILTKARALSLPVTFAGMLLP